MKKILQVFLLVLISTLSLALTSCDEGNTLYLLNWDEYIDEELIVEFEKKYNCSVVLDIAQSNETMFSKIVSDSAPYDIAFPSDYMIGQMLECDDVEVDAPILKPIDFTKLKNYSESIFDEKLMAMINKDCPELKKYCVPYFWGSLGIMYNTKNLSEEQVSIIEEKGWDVLFEPNLLGNVKIGMYASARDSIAAGLLYNGYSLNSKDNNELQKAGDSLFGMNYHAWATDELKTGVAIGKYDLALVYSGDFFDTLYSAYDVPEDVEPEIDFNMIAPANNNVFFDAMVIPKNSMNEDLAYKFIDFMIDQNYTNTDGEVQNNALLNAQYVGYCPTIASVFNEMINDPDYEGIADLDVYYPGNITNGEIYKYLGTQTYSVYDSIYKKVKK